MTFEAYLKDRETGLYGIALNGTLTFTFSNSMLLDERLKEAFLYVVNSDVEYFEPTTEICVIAYSDDKTESKPYFYIISSDRAQELPNGRGKYKHEIHLLERTKLLEGIYCPTLTFTNSQGNTYTKQPRKSIGVITYDGNGNDVSDSLKRDISDYLSTLYKTPIESTSQINATDDDGVLLPKALAENASTHLNETGAYDGAWAPSNFSPYVYSLTIAKGTSVIETYDGDSISVDSVVIGNDTATLTYNIQLYYGTNPTVAHTLSVDLEFTYTIWGAQNHYPLKPWTIKECVNRVLDLCEPIFDGEKPRFKFAPSQETKYGSVRIPELTMTQCTLREALKLVGSIIHAEPRLGGFEGIEWHDNYIYFDPYDETTEANISISKKPYVYKAYNRDINEYCTHLETSAKNLVNALNYAQGVVTEPSVNGYRTIRTETVNVILSESNSYASTDNKIYDIPSDKGSVLVTLYKVGGDDDDEDYTIFEDVDITPYIFRDTEYNNLSSYEGGYPYTKHYALYYSQGQEGIRGLFYKVENAIDSLLSDYAIVNIINQVTGGDYKTDITDGFNRLAFKISYIPIYDTKLSHSKSNITLGKTPFMRVFNQSENLIETRAFGENIKAIASKMGNVEQTRTYILKSLEDIPEVSQTIDGFVIVDVKCEFQQSFIKCTVQMTKDFRVNRYVGISSQKRVYEVSEHSAYERDILIKNYIVVSDADEVFKDNIDNNALIQNIIPIKQIFDPTINNKIEHPINVVRAYSYAKKGSDNTKYGKVLLPVISSAIGNAMIFSWDYKDNYSAGSEIGLAEYNETAEKKITAKWQRDIAYGDYYGRAYWHKFGLFSNLEIDDPYAQANTVRDVNDGDIDGDLYTENALLLRKDNRERLSFNYEIEFVTTKDDIIIGSALASSCPLVTAQTSDTAPKVYFYNSKIGKFNKKPPSVSETYGYVRVTENGIEFDIPNNVEFDSWAIISPTRNKQYTFEDEDGNVTSQYMFEGGEILLARNKSKTQYGNATTEIIKFQIARTIYN